MASRMGELGGRQPLLLGHRVAERGKPLGGLQAQQGAAAVGQLLGHLSANVARQGQGGCRCVSA